MNWDRPSECKHGGCEYFCRSDWYKRYATTEQVYIPARCSFYHPPRQIPTMAEVRSEDSDDLYCIAIFKPREE